MRKPESLNICGIPYRVEYCDRTVDVDPESEHGYWGQIKYKEQLIRVYDNNCAIEFVWNNIMHEVLHGIGEAVNLEILKGEDGDNKKHNELDALARALTNFLFRNDLIKVDSPNSIPVTEKE
jgi:hypothetical protein